MVCNKLKQVVIDKPTHNAESGKVKILSFLHLNNIAKYNKEMEDADLADQLHASYQLNKNTHNRKWWWVIMFQPIGTMIYNTYVMYYVANLAHFRKKKRNIVIHLQFREAIAKYQINPDAYFEEKKK